MDQDLFHWAFVLLATLPALCWLAGLRLGRAGALRSTVQLPEPLSTKGELRIAKRNIFSGATALVIGSSLALKYGDHVWRGDGGLFQLIFFTLTSFLTLVAATGILGRLWRYYAARPKL